MNAFTGQTFKMHQVLSLKEVMRITQLGRATIYNMLDPKAVTYDETFPKQIKLSTNRVGWIASELHTWIESKMANR
ncbi:helix-turn-helix transcriptional regulator [Acinetobacter haemolyticus]|uniref:AlpA family phage regulatory protein n=1 Tax=Acinetobacter haemolyticus TaxID=29430 RepID=A0AAW4JEQ4_ACIHA|nr:AlpA family phage regulatory protein [Acinetobacter haemolyticus]MBO3658436.1 AlpA family phage regulatory protein [Acinetobacter haemolyticus]